jgi:hypothetical protein
MVIGGGVDFARLSRLGAAAVMLRCTVQGMDASCTVQSNDINDLASSNLHFPVSLPCLVAQLAPFCLSFDGFGAVFFSFGAGFLARFRGSGTVLRFRQSLDFLRFFAFDHLRLNIFDNVRRVRAI